MNLNTLNPDCTWCIWKIVGHNYEYKPVYYPIDYCGYHGRIKDKYFYTIDDIDRVFLSSNEAYEYDVNANPEYHGCKDWSMDRMDGLVGEYSYDELNQEQKEYLHYRLGADC